MIWIVLVFIALYVSGIAAWLYFYKKERISK